MSRSIEYPASHEGIDVDNEDSLKKATYRDMCMSIYELMDDFIAEKITEKELFRDSYLIFKAKLIPPDRHSTTLKYKWEDENLRRELREVENATHKRLKKAEANADKWKRRMKIMERLAGVTK